MNCSAESTSNLLVFNPILNDAIHAIVLSEFILTTAVLLGDVTVLKFYKELNYICLNNLLALF